MKSTEKAYLILEEMSEMDDQEIAEALPIPVPTNMARGILAFIAPKIPQDHRILDQFLTEVGDFCHGLRTDAAEQAAS